MKRDFLIICRGGGDLATGIAYRLTKAGFRVLILEAERPAAIRRQVCFCEAVYEGTVQVEEISAVRITEAGQMEAVLDQGMVPVLVDPEGKCIADLAPDVVVDAIIAKKNLGTRITMAPLVIGVGPGFCAGEDVHVVVETMRGHNLARLIYEGGAMPNTGIPGMIGGYTRERVIHAEKSGVLKNISRIGDVVEQGQEIAGIYGQSGPEEDYLPVTASISGVLRGLIRDGYEVTRGFKIADIDPRLQELQNCFTISDKARSIGGSVLEAVCNYVNR